MTHYIRPEVKDHGSLAALTADFDVHFVGSVAKVLTIAAASAPGMIDPPSTSVDTDPTDPTGPTGPIDPTDPTGPGDPTDPPGEGGTRGENEDSPGTGVRTERESSDGIPTEGLPIADSPGGGSAPGGGSLPFTGYAAWVAAATGAAMTSAGITLRRVLSRHD